VVEDAPSFPRLHLADPVVGDPPSTAMPPGLDQLLAALEPVTGWRIALHPDGTPRGPASCAWTTPIAPGLMPRAGFLSLAPRDRAPGRGKPARPLRQITPLAEALAGLLGELYRTRYALWQREAELATSIPVVSTVEDRRALAHRLEAVLRGGAEAIGCQAAALYLLDDATSQLKLRAQWNLPAERFVDPPRPLAWAMADLEALTGHAVVIEETALLPHWNVPERFPAAVCVPVSSPTVPLGTLWMFCDQCRDFSPAETQIVEIIAGRLAAELERDVLLRQQMDARDQGRELAEAARWQQQRLPHRPPDLDDWEVAAATPNAAANRVDFFNWYVHQDGGLSLYVGGVQARGLTGLLASAALQATVQTQMRAGMLPQDVLAQTNDALWTSSAGGQIASLFFGRLDHQGGGVRVSTAGDAAAFQLCPHGWQPLGSPAPPLGSDAEAAYLDDRKRLMPGDVLVVICPGLPPSAEDRTRPAITVAEMLLRCDHLPAQQMADLAGELISQSTNSGHGGTVLVARRRDGTA